MTKLTGSDAGVGDYLGRAVALDGHTVLIGAPQHGGGAGAAYVFVQRGVTWREERKTVGDDTAGGDLFGHVLAVSGDAMIVGAPHDDHWGENAGAAYVFTRNQGGANWWGQMERLPINPGPGGLLGSAVDIDGDRLVVGAPGQDWAYICERNEGGADAWRIARSIPGVAGDRFGTAVAISGD